jgi:phosphatidylserine decarboxylase
MKIHRAGIIPILTLLTGVGGILLLLNLLFPLQTPVHYFLYLAGFIFMIFVLRFFRFPARRAPEDPRHVYSGADGRVVAIEKVFVEEYFGEERLQISVFMSITNVHINWYPVGGEVVYRKHHQGRHLVAFNPKSSMLNEHTTLVLRDAAGHEVMLRQIAGAVARRILCRAEEGRVVKQGDVLGMIRFGSRVDLLLPADAEVKVSLGQQVRACHTVMAALG